MRPCRRLRRERENAAGRDIWKGGQRSPQGTEKGGWSAKERDLGYGDQLSPQGPERGDLSVIEKGEQRSPQGTERGDLSTIEKGEQRSRGHAFIALEVKLPGHPSYMHVCTALRVSLLRHCLAYLRDCMSFTSCTDSPYLAVPSFKLATATATSAAGCTSPHLQVKPLPRHGLGALLHAHILRSSRQQPQHANLKGSFPSRHCLHLSVSTLLLSTGSTAVKASI